MFYNDSMVDLSTCKKAKKGTRIAVMLIDYFLVLIFAFSIFAFIARPIFDALPSTAKITEEYGEKQEAVTKVIVDTGLRERLDDGSLKSVTSQGKEYVKDLVKSRYSLDGTEYYEIDKGKKKVVEVLPSSRLDYQVDGDYVNDQILSYFLSYREENKASYIGDNFTSYSLERINTELLDLDDTNKDIVDSDFDYKNNNFTLSRKSAEILLDYLNYGTSSGETLYNRVVNMYSIAICTGLNELEASFSPYIDAFNMFKAVSSKYSKSFIWTIVLSYVFAFLICYVVFPLIFKRGKTIGYKFYSLGALRTDLMDMKIFNYVIKDFVIFIESFSSIFLMALMLGKLNVLSVPFIGSINLFQLCLFSALVSLISLVYFFVNKKNQTLSELASLSYTVNTKEHEEDYLIEIDRKANDNGK